MKHYLLSSLFVLTQFLLFAQKGYFESFEKGIKIGVNWVDLSNNKRSLVLPAVYDHLYFLQQDMVRIDSNGFIGVYNLAKRRYELPFGQEKINLYGKKRNLH